MLKELDSVSKQFKQQDVDVFRKDISLFQNQLSKEAQSTLADAEKIATKKKRNNVTILVVIHE